MIDHAPQAQLFAALTGQGQANQAAAVLRHEIDGFGRNELSGHHQIAFILAVFFIDQHHHFAVA